VIVPWPGSLPDYKTSSLLLVWLARVLNTTLIDDAVFDVRVLAALYLLCLLLGVYLILVSSRGWKRPWRMVLAALLFMFTDPAYIAYFNSFYSEPTAVVCLVLLVGCALCLITGRTASWVPLAGYFLAGAMLVVSKPMFIPFAPVLALHGMYLARLTAVNIRHGLSGALACGLLFAAVWYQTQTPARLRSNAQYLAIFTVLLKQSPAPERDAQDLGLKSEWLRFIGSDPYDDHSPAKNSVFDAEFARQVDSLTVPRFFLHHPGRFYHVVSGVARQASGTRVPFLGYYEKTTGRPPLTQPPAPWSDVRRWLMPGSVWFFVPYFLSGPVALVGSPRRCPPCIARTTRCCSPRSARSRSR
jgi:hypothetical protein